MIGWEKKGHKTLGQSVVTLNWSLPFSRSFFLNGSCKTATLQLVVVFSFFVRHQIEICHSTARLIDTGFCSSVVYGEVVSIHFFSTHNLTQKKKKRDIQKATYVRRSR